MKYYVPNKNKTTLIVRMRWVYSIYGTYAHVGVCILFVYTLTHAHTRTHHRMNPLDSTAVLRRTCPLYLCTHVHAHTDTSQHSHTSMQRLRCVRLCTCVCMCECVCPCPSARALRVVLEIQVFRSNSARARATRDHALSTRGV